MNATNNVVAVVVLLFWVAKGFIIIAPTQALSQALSQTVRQNNASTAFFFADSTEKVYYEIHPLPTLSADTVHSGKQRCLVLFRLRYDVLSFRRLERTASRAGEEREKASTPRLEEQTAPSTLNRSRSRASQFLALPIVVVECTDAEGIIRASAQWQDSVWVGNLGATLSKDDYVCGSVVVWLAPSTYSFFLEIGDKSLPRALKLRERTVNIPPMVLPQRTSQQFTAEMMFGKPLFAVARGLAPNDIGKATPPPVLVGQSLLEATTPRTSQTLSHGSDDTIHPIYPLCANAMLFGLETRVLLPVVYQPRRVGEDAFVATLRMVDEQHQPVSALQSTVAVIHKRSTIEPVAMPAMQSASHVMQIVAVPAMQPTTTPDADGAVVEGGILEIPIAAANLPEGSYQLTVVHQPSKQQTVVRFAVRWLAKPASLRNIEYAVEMLRYLLTDAEYTSLMDAPAAQQRERFAEFWRRNDPTPSTLYNEALAAYYKRVDEAFFAFTSVPRGVSDGAKSDRGKVYILCGEPTSVEKTSFAVGNRRVVQERWRYANAVNKEFVFETNLSNEPTLKQVIDLP
jgi:GWxTD domain-containing protein